MPYWLPKASLPYALTFTGNLMILNGKNTHTNENNIISFAEP